MWHRGILRPPGALAEKDFLARCVHCGQCAQVCPYGSVRIRTGWGWARHTPEIVPQRVPCYLCMKCPPVCPSGALQSHVVEIHNAGMGHAVILRDKCHNFTSGVMCWTCYDRCPLRGTAIVLHDGFIPTVTTDCVGCGICEYVCPVGPDKAIVTLPPGTFAPANALPMITVRRGERDGE